MKNSADFEVGYNDALDYFTTMASLSRLLNDPSMKAFLEKLDKNEERTVGNLVAFMNSHNLRFGPATSDRQLEIYKTLIPILTAVRDQVKTAGYTPAAPDRSGEGLRAAAKDAFKPMTWDQLESARQESITVAAKLSGDVFSIRLRRGDESPHQRTAFSPPARGG